MKASLDQRIARANELAETHPSARGLLTFYRDLAVLQKPVFEELQSRGETDIHALLRHFPALLELVRRKGPAPLAGELCRAVISGLPTNPGYPMTDDVSALHVLTGETSRGLSTSDFDRKTDMP